MSECQKSIKRQSAVSSTNRFAHMVRTLELVLHVLGLRFSPHRFVHLRNATNQKCARPYVKTRLVSLLARTLITRISSSPQNVDIALFITHFSS